MRVRLVSFGPLKTMFPEGAAWRELKAGESVAALLTMLSGEGTLPESALQSAAIAVNHKYAARHQTLEDGDEVAILPPVSGGAGMVAGSGEVRA